ncbi:hypothetical protein V8F20_005106 [Naviculisporaceae sp. PSN 640]
MLCRRSRFLCTVQFTAFGIGHGIGQGTIPPVRTEMPGLTIAAATGTTTWLPLITGFTPPAECSSLTIVHQQRYVGVYQGCVGRDESCCPPESLRRITTYSPGRCPTGYTTQDPHVGLDRLGTDTEEWEATCVMSGFSSCHRPFWELPGARNPRCSVPYTSPMPSLTSALTAVVIYYEPYDISSPDRIGHSTTTVLTPGSTWPVLLPAMTAPTGVSISHFVIRWRDGDFAGDDPPYPAPTGPRTLPPPVGTSASNPDPTSSPDSSQGISSPAALVGMAFGAILLLIGLCCGTVYMRRESRRRRRGAQRGVEMDYVGDGTGFGIRVIHGHDPSDIDTTYTEEEESSSPAGSSGDGEDHEESNAKLADIVLVHGLNGQRMRTWTLDNCCWPRDLLPQTLPGTRIMTFGYDSAVVRSTGTSANSIELHAGSLLSDLSAHRKDDPQRPIIFIGHSLGGILIKDALCKASVPGSPSHHKQIFDNTYGIIFLGTPHRGSGYARLSVIGSAFAWFWQGMNLRLLQALRQDSELLRRINSDFLQRYFNIRPQMRICSFAEELPMLALFSQPIVNSSSAFMDIPYEIRETIWASHRDICRFSDGEDVGYKRLVRWITEFVAEAAQAERARRAHEAEAEARRRSRVPDSLMDVINLDAESADIVD